MNNSGDNDTDMCTSLLADILENAKENKCKRMCLIKTALVCLINLITDDVSVTKIINAAIKREIKTEKNIIQNVYHIKDLDDARKITRILFITLHSDNYIRRFRGQSYIGDMSKKEWASRSGTIGMVWNAIDELIHMERKNTLPHR